MRLLALGVSALGLLLLCAPNANADPCTPTPITTWGVTNASNTVATAPALDSPVARARDLLARAKILDDQATADEKTSIDLQARLPQLRVNAKAARDKADHAPPAEKDAAVANAEQLAADVTVSEAEVISRKRMAVDNRQTASMLRARALHIVRENTNEPYTDEGSPCDPPFRFTNDGRKIYRLECFR